jgi:ligand-binding sensor domain-containing protein
MDDNDSSAYGQTLVFPAPDAETPHVSVLFNGFAPEASNLVSALQEPSVLIQPDFSPDIVEQSPVIVVPSGGLYGLEGSDFFRASLQEYANRGGTIIAFDQQHGSEYNVLPGGELGGYGWAEDTSCTRSSLYIQEYDQVLSGFDKAVLKSNVDGYFTDLPDGADVLLRRTKNGQPAMVRYDYGAGTVIAATTYDDWGAANWQTTSDAYILNRDLLAWAIDPALLPEFDPGDAFSLPVGLVNESDTSAAFVQLSLLAPGKEIVAEETRPISLTAGAAVSVTFETTAALPLGIWWVDYTLLDAEEQIVQTRRPGERFVVKDPDPLSAPVKDVAVVINAPGEYFIRGAEGEFTFTVYNNTNVTRTFEARYGLPHHTWETGDRGTYGNFRGLVRTVVVGPHSQEQFVHVFTMRTNDRLFVYLYEDDVLRDRTWFQTRLVPARPRTVVSTNQGEYGRGQTVEMTVEVTNPAYLNANLTLEVKVTAPDKTLIFSDTRPLPLSPGQFRTEAFDFVLSDTVPNGTFYVRADVYQGEARASGNLTSFVLPPSPAYFEAILPTNLPISAGTPLYVVVTNTHAYLPVTGTLGLVVTDPDDVATTIAAQSYALTAGQTTSVTFDLTDLPARLGHYYFKFTTSDQYGQGRWYEAKQASLLTGVEFDQRSYRVRDTLGLTVTVHNDGEFDTIPQTTLAIPDLSFSDVQVVPLDAGETNVLTFSLPLPASLSPGLHDVNLTVEAGDTISKTYRFSIPYPRIVESMSQTDYRSGDALAVELTNVGGVDALVTYTLALRDHANNLLFLEQEPSNPFILVDQSVVVSGGIPITLASGDYLLELDGQCAPANRPVFMRRWVAISGADVQARASFGPHLSGGALPVSLINHGGVDAVVTYTLALRNREVELFLGQDLTGTPVSAHESVVVTGTVPEGTQSGIYALWVTGVYSPGDRLVELARPVQVSGPVITLAAYTDRESYLTVDNITVTGQLTNTGRPLPQGNLKLEIVRRGSGDGAVNRAWQMYTSENSGLSFDLVVAVQADVDGSIWFGSGTPWQPGPAMAVRAREMEQDDVTLALDRLSPDLETWQSFPLPDDFSYAEMKDIARDSKGQTWVATTYGVGVLATNGITWSVYTSYDSGLLDNWVNAVAVDDEDNVWFATAEGVSQRTTTGQWYAYTMFDSGLVDNWVNTVAVDEAGDVWFGTGGGLNKLTFSGTWITYTTDNSGLLTNDVLDIAFDGQGNVWLVTPGWDDAVGISVLLTDGGWATYTTSNSDLYSSYVNAIAVDEQNRKWIGYVYDGVSVLSADNTTWEHYWNGSLVEDILPVPNGDVWLATAPEEYTEPAPGNGGAMRVFDTDQAWEINNKGNSGLSCNEVTAVEVCAGGSTWFGSKTYEGSGGEGEGEGGLVLALDRLLPDLGTWQSFSLPAPLSDGWDVREIACGNAGQTWVATSAGVGRLAADMTTWITFTVGNSDLVDDWVNAVAVDGDGDVWFGSEGGVSQRTATGQWYTYTTANSGLVDNWVRALAVDDAGDVWIGTGDGLSKLSAGGVWTTYDTGNSGLLTNDVQDIAFDDQGNVWLATPDWGDEGGLSVLLAGGGWVTFTIANSSLANPSVTAIAVDGEGRKWIGARWEGVSVLSADNTAWEHYIPESNSSIVNDVASASSGDVWLGTSPASGDVWPVPADEGGAVRMYKAEGTGPEILWTRQLTTGLDSPDVFLDVSSLTASSLGATGRLILQGTLDSETTGQTVASDHYPFYVFSTAVRLTLEADQEVYLPGQSLTASGALFNGSALMLTDQLITITLDGQVIYTTPLPFDLLPGESHPFTAVAALPLEDGLVTLEALSPLAEVNQVVQVVSPVVEARLSAPALVGREPFLAGVTVTNTGSVPAIVDVTIVNVVTDCLILNPGATVHVQGLSSITQDTAIVASISGDLNQTLTTTVRFGEAATMAFGLEPTYAAGPVAVPYVLTNTGLLSVSLDANVVLRDGGGETVVTLVIPADLPLGESQPGTLSFGHLAAGAYTLDYSTPFESGVETFAVLPARQVSLTALAGTANGITIPVTATVSNAGFYPFSGQVFLQTDFFATSVPVSDLVSGQDVALPLSVNTRAAIAGDYVVQLDLLDEVGAFSDGTTVTVTVPASDLTLTSLPANLTLPVSTVVTFTFGVANHGATSGEGTLHFTFSDVEDEEQHIWLPGGENGSVDFTFFVPPDLEAKTYAATYVFDSTPGVLLLTVEGTDVSVTPSLDEAGYREGETASLTLHVQELAAQATPPLYALVRFNDYSDVQPFNLTPLGSVDLTFSVPVSFLGDEKVFYGIYSLTTDRSIYLNTVYLPRLYPSVSVLTDKQVYQPGETVVATVLTTATGQLDVVAPGFADTISLSGADTSFSFVLPTLIARGSYSIDSTPRNCNCVNQDQTLRTLFDVDAPEVRVTEAHLEPPNCVPGGTNRLDLNVASDRPVTARFLTWLQRPDGSVVYGPEQTVNLAASPVNQLTALLAPDTDQSGMHHVHYRLVDPSDEDLVYGSGVETCDVGQAIVISVATDEPSYAAGESVGVTVTIYATQPGWGELALDVDGLPAYNQTIPLTAGFEQREVNLGSSFSPGMHDLRAVLTQSGLASDGETSFDYGFDLPDLSVQPPFVFSGGTLTRTARLFIANQGASATPTTTVALYDGNPAVGGQLVEAASVPPLAASEDHVAYIFWSIAGQEGVTMTLYARVDPDDVISESQEDNNESAVEIKLPPKVQAGPPQAADEGDTVNLTEATFSGPDALETYTATVQWAIGSYVTPTVPVITVIGDTGVLSSSYTPLDDGIYTVFVEVCDAGDICAFDTLTVTVDNVAPTVDVGPDQVVNVGESVNFSGVFADPGLADTHVITWTFGDASLPLLGILEPVTHSYDVPGVYTVTLTVADDDGGVGDDTLLVLVREAAPDLICENLTQAVNYVDNGYAPACTGITLEPHKLKLVDSECNPIANARVNLRKENGAYITYKLTDANGVADFGDYSGGAVPSKFEVNYNGATYATAVGSYDIGTFVQTRKYHLQFIASDCSLIENARVNLRKASDAYVTYTRTGGDGVASFQVVPEAQMKLEVNHNGAVWRSEANTANVDVVLGAEAFRLSLIDSIGFPIENARVNLRKANDAYVTYTRTDSDGLASFEVVPEGALKLEVDYHGATFATPTSTSHAPETVQTMAFSLLLTDSQGDLIESARVNLRKSNDAYVTYERTSADGVAAFEVVPEAQMKLEVDYHGATYATPVTEVTADTQLEVQTKAFSLRLVDSSGQPIENARVNLRKANDAYVTYEQTDTDGIATFEVVPEAQMKLEVDYHGATYATPVTEVVADTQLEVQTKAFSLRLIDSTGQPIENARVNLRKADGAYVTYEQTGADGIATFEVVPEAQMKLEVDYHGGTYETETTIVSSDVQIDVNTVPLIVHLTAQGADLVNQRVDLLKANDAYVTYTQTGADGRASFEVLPAALHKVRSTYDGDVWVSDAVTGPVEVVHDFD